MRPDEVAYALSCRFRARRELGIVTLATISSLVRQYLQAVDIDPRDSNLLKSLVKRRRGGQPGNENRRIHGYYAQDARRLESGIRALEALMGHRLRKRTRNP